jgi:hypothetical protein
MPHASLVPHLHPAQRNFLLDFETVGGGVLGTQQEEKPRTYYFLVANAKFMLDDEEHFQEQLQEKLRLYEERSMEQDFWLVIEPKFLDKFPNVTKRLKRPAVALVSTDRNWIRYVSKSASLQPSLQGRAMYAFPVTLRELQLVRDDFMVVAYRAQCPYDIGIVACSTAVWYISSCRCQHSALEHV